MGGIPVAALGDQPADRAGPGMGAHDAGHRIVVGDGNGRQVQHGGTVYVFLGVGGPGEEGEIGRDAELGEHGGQYIPVLFSRGVRVEPGIGPASVCGAQGHGAGGIPRRFKKIQ